MFFIYLGVTLDRKFNYLSHLKDTITNTRCSAARLFPLLRRKSTLNLPNKIFIFKSIRRSQFTYAAPIWIFFLSPRSLKLLEVQQNNYFRLLRRAILHEKCTNPRRPLDPSSEEILILPLQNYLEKASLHPNPDIEGALNAELSRRYRRTKVIGHLADV